MERGEGAGNRLTIGDFVLFSLYQSMVFTEDNTKPIVATVREKVAETPVIGQYVERMKV